MADPIDPNAAAQAARGLRMPGVGGMLSNAASTVGNALGGLRDGAMNMIGRAAPTAAPAAPTASAPTPAAAPGAIQRAAGALGDAVGNAASTVGNTVRGAVDAAGTAINGMRAGAQSGPFLEGDASIPTLNNVLQPGVGPNPPVPDIPTLTDVIPNNHPMLENARAPVNPNVPAGGMSAERAAFNAEQGLRMGPVAPRSTGPLPASALESVADFARPVTSAIGDAAGAGLRMAQPLLNVANKVAPVMTPLMAGLSAAHSYGTSSEDYARRMGVDAPQNLGGDLGVRAAGVLGDLGNTLTFGLADRLGNALSGGGFGHSAFYDGDKPATPDIVGTHWGSPAAPAGAPASPAAAAEPPDVAEFNAAMAKQHANAQMTVDGTGMRTIGNPTQASATDIAANDKRLAGLTAERAAGMRENDAWAQNQMDRASDAARTNQLADPYRLNDDIEQAKRSGNPAQIQAAYNARDNTLRTITADHDSMRQAGVQMRGQDIQAGSARAANQLGMYNALREQGNADRQFGREAGNDQFTHGEAAEKHLDEALTSRFTTGTDKDGKPQVDVQGKAEALAGIQRSAAAMGANSVNDLSKVDRERLIAGADLATKVNKDASNILPWKPDVIGNVMPHDLVGLTRNASGDYVIPRGAAAGRVIPARYLNKVGADRIGGQPTDIYDNLKAN